MNENNVKALARILVSLGETTGLYMKGDAANWANLAAALAAQGVLVPTSLTDNETVRITGLGWPDHMDPMRFNPLVNRIVREEMERIAKGEKL
jgi:hypothetical protein